jgi:GDP-4-dehydro-6-deoxy-D-mannose reductase
MMRSLITGIDGFVGSHLAALLLQHGDEVGGTYNYDPKLRLLGEHAGRVRTWPLDVRDSAQIDAVLAHFKPDRVYHLAAIAFVPISFENPRLVFDVNLFGTINLYDCLRKLSLNPKVLFVSTADVYGMVSPEDLPINESHLAEPTNPYAVSKLAAELISTQYAHNYGMNIVCVRPFNHIGPGQSPKFVCSDFAKQIAEIEARKRQPVMLVGNLETRRDFSDVHDVTRAYVLAMDKCPGDGSVYNIGSGQSHSIREILDTLLAMSKTKIKVERDSERMRPSDTPDVYGDCSRFQKATGWKPKHDLKKTLTEILDYWRANV